MDISQDGSSAGHPKQQEASDGSNSCKRAPFVCCLLNPCKMKKLVGLAFFGRSLMGAGKNFFFIEYWYNNLI